MKKLFTESKTFYGFQDKEVSDETLIELYDLVKNNATSFNCQPLRIIFIKDPRPPAGRARPGRPERQRENQNRARSPGPYLTFII